MRFFRSLFGKKERATQGHDHRLGHSNLQESQLTKVDSDAKEGAGRNDDQGPTQDDFMKDIMKGLKDTQNERIKEIQERHDIAAAQGMLPPPDIAVDYDCECGSKSTFHMRNLNLKGGLNVQCVKCGAVLHVPPTVLDHKEYWSAGGGASLVPNWRDQMRFINHGNR